ncbi:MAG: hypothetical protein IPK72_24755 [Candidatus Eisenbacteria bacterium]|nr:hypothetical protein [Candidatus Eisenbacteria bacterium]
MIAFGVGGTTVRTYHLKRSDSDCFDEAWDVERGVGTPQSRCVARG